MRFGANASFPYPDRPAKPKPEPVVVEPVVEVTPEPTEAFVAEIIIPQVEIAEVSADVVAVEPESVEEPSDDDEENASQARETWKAKRDRRKAQREEA